MEKVELNKKQKKGVMHTKGPLLIIAGAGTGKTAVITQKINYLIVDKKIPTDKILALTFTDKAAYEMQERVDEALPYGYTNLWINTFHSFCEAILREEAHNIGLDPSYRLLSESESVLFLIDNIFDLGLKVYKPLGNPLKFMDALLTHFSRLKDEDISPEEYLKYSRKFEIRNSKFEITPEEIAQTKELANAYKKYEELKIKNSLMDFSDLISNTLALFRKRPDILRKYQQQFKYILVDEFQDTNFAQNELAILLSGRGKNITVVADDDQSIYRFRGAAVSNVLQFKKNFKNAKIITLTQNFRSTQEILDSAYTLIQNNNPRRLEVIEKIDKRLKSSIKNKNFKIELIHKNRAEDEADEVANVITNLSKTYEYRDFAILVRANNHSQTFSSALARRKIPYQFLGPGYLFAQEEIKDLIAYILFLSDLSDSVSLFRILSIETFGILALTLNYLLNFSKKKNITLFESLFVLGDIRLNPKSREKLENIREMLKHHIESTKKEKAGQILYYFLIDSGLLRYFEKNESLKNERKIQNIAKFFDRIKNFESENSDANVYSTAKWLNLMLKMGDSPLASDIDLQDQNAVNILSVHASKGLEFKVVFLVNLVSDRFPTRARKDTIPIPDALIKENISKDSDYNLEEERRLFYVGMTRARERLYFTASDFYAGGKRKKKLSPFIYEALPEIKIKEEISEKSQQLSLSKALLTYEEKDEEEKAATPYKVRYLTYSNLQMFDICPLHYKAKVIYNIPTPTSSVQSFGISVHNALYRFFRLIQENKNPTFNALIKLLESEWINEGYQNKAHERERFDAAKQNLRMFYNLEKPFKKPLMLEMPFTFILENGVKVFGKIDRVDGIGHRPGHRLGEVSDSERRASGPEGIEIIDYKTGADNPKADAAHKLQLSMYALAATKVNDPVLNKSPDDIKLSIYFLDGNKSKSMSFTKEDLSVLEKDLMNKVEEIEKSKFKCSRNIICENCEYKMLCNTIS